MGLFDKIKQNLSHGGVKLRVNAAASVSMQDDSQSIQVLKPGQMGGGFNIHS